VANSNDPKTNRKMGIAYAAGLTLFVSVVFLCGVGWLLDRWLETAPWLMVSGLVLGAVVGFYQFVKLTSKL
jgi:ATP synthase protein I